MRRKVTSSGVRMNPGHRKSRFVGGSIYYTLECGHEAVRKLSTGIAQHIQCKECDALSRGSVRTWEVGVPPKRFRETWDADKKMPKLECIQP